MLRWPDFGRLPRSDALEGDLLLTVVLLAQHDKGHGRLGEQNVIIPAPVVHLGFILRP